MIINLDSIYKKIIIRLVRKNFNIKLRKSEEDTIISEDLSVEDGYIKIIELLRKTKRIKRTNIFARLWRQASNYWRA